MRFAVCDDQENDLEKIYIKFKEISGQTSSECKN